MAMNMNLPYIISITSISSYMLLNNAYTVNCYHPPPRVSLRPWQRRCSILHHRRVILSWQPTRRHGSRLSSNFYDDFEDFGDFGSEDSSCDEEGGVNIKPKSDGSTRNKDDDVMRELRARMNDLSDDDEEEEEEEEEGEIFDDVDSGSTFLDLEGNSISNVDELIGFAQAKVREKGGKTQDFKAGGGGTWTDENWAKPLPYIDGLTGEMLDLNNILEGGVVLVANPAKFCSDLADDKTKGKGKANPFWGALFDDPFPTSPKPSNSISPALLAKFGITMPPSPDLGPDRRADLLPVVVLIDHDPLMCKAALWNRRTGNLMGDLPPSLFEMEDGDASEGRNGNEFSSHPLSAFMIQPLWWAGSSPGGNGMEDEANPSVRGGGLRNIDIVHACPYVNNSVPLPKSDGLYWGGDPIQAQEAMKDSRLEKPLSGFDFKFFIQTTRWLPDALEQEIKDGTWFLATVSKEVLFRSRDRLGAKRAKPLWTEIMELLGDDYKHIRYMVYGKEDE